MENTPVSSINERIDEALNSIRPYLQADGGDVELVEVKDSNDVVLRLTGACSSCIIRTDSCGFFRGGSNLCFRASFVRLGQSEAKCSPEVF